MLSLSKCVCVCLFLYPEKKIVVFRVYGLWTMDSGLNTCRSSNKQTNNNRYYIGQPTYITRVVFLPTLLLFDKISGLTSLTTHTHTHCRSNRARCLSLAQNRTMGTMGGLHLHHCEPYQFKTPELWIDSPAFAFSWTNILYSSQTRKILGLDSITFTSLKSCHKLWSEN